MKNNVPYNVMRHAGWDAAPRMPQFIGSALATAFPALGTSIAGTSITYASIIAYAAYTAVSAIALRALAPDMPSAEGLNKGRLINTRNPVGSQEYVYGQVRKGGTIIFMETTDADREYKPENAYMHIVVALAGHEVEEIGDIYLNDTVVNIDGDGFVTDDEWQTATSPDGGGISPGNEQPAIRIKKYTGSQTTADPDLVAETSATSSFVGNGIAYVYMRLLFDRKTFANGMPVITAVVKGKKVTDLNGTPQTYPASANAALVIRDYLMSDYGLNDSNIDATYFATAESDCNDAIPLAAGGTEPRYQINGVVNSESTIGQTLQDMVRACNGALFISGGEWRLKVGVYDSSVQTFTLDDFRSEIDLPTKLSRRDNFNSVVGTFVNAGVYDESTNPTGGDWVEADYPAITSAALLEEDGGVENQLDLPLLMVTSPSQAQRVAKQTLYRSRQQMTISADFGLRALNVEIGDTVALTIAEYGWTAKEFEVASWKLLIAEGGGLRVNMILRETDQDAFDWDAEETAVVNNNTTLSKYTGGLDVSGLNATSGAATIQPDGTYMASEIISWTGASSAFVDYYQVQWLQAGSTNYSSTSTTLTEVELFPLQADTLYFYRVRSISSGGTPGAWSDSNFTTSVDTTAPGVPTPIGSFSGYTQITLKWTNPSDKDLKEIQVYANSSNTTTGATLVGTVTGDTFIHSGLPQSTTRYYFLKSVDYTGNVSAFSSSLSGTTLTNPSAGATGDTIVAGRVYYQTLQATAPTPTPSASSFNTSTGELVGLTSGWAQTQPVVNLTDTSLLEWSSQFTVTIDGTTSSQTITFSTPSGAIQFASDIESDNYVANVSGWKISRSGDVAEFGSASIRGTLSVGQIPTLTSSKISDLSTVATSGDYTDLSNAPDLSEYATVTQLNSKTKVFSSSSAPTAEAVGDLWYDTLNDNFKRWTGSAWSAVSLIADSVISSYVYAGEINAAQITAGLIEADQIKLDGVTIDTDGSGNVIVADGGIGSDKIATSLQSTNYVSGESGWKINKSGSVEFQDAIIRGSLDASDINAGTLNADRIDIDGVTLDTSAGKLIVASGGVDTSQLATSSVITSTIAARQVTDAYVASSSTLTLTSSGSISLGSFNTTEANQFIIVQASANAYGTGSSGLYSLNLTIDGFVTSIFLNSTQESYATYSDIRFPISILDRRVVSSSGSHSLGLSYTILSGNTLELTKLSVVITVLKR